MFAARALRFRIPERKFPASKKITPQTIQVMPDPEQIARQEIDALLGPCGWVVQDKNAVNLAASRGVAVRELSFKTGEPDYTLFVSPLPEQDEIIAEVERRFSIVEAFEAVLAANLRRAERLRQSILRCAFKGKLLSAVSNEPFVYLKRPEHACEDTVLTRSASHWDPDVT